MKIAYGTYAMPMLSLEHALNMIKDVGYDGVELCISPKHNSMPADLDAAKREKLKGLLKEYNLGVPSLFMLGSALTEDKKAHEERLDLTRQVVELSRDLDQAFGYQGWPVLLEKIGFVLVGVLLLLAVTFMIIGRRGSGVAHMLRVAVGSGLLLGSLAALGEAMPRHYTPDVQNMLNSGQVGPAIDRMLTLVDLTTTVAFLSAPLFAYLNYRVIRTDVLPEDARPSLWLYVLTWIGLAFFVCFSVAYLVMRVSAQT